jgi:hypothetical protein
VSNPLRCPAVIRRFRSQQKNKRDWDNLVMMLDAVEEARSADFVLKLFDQTLAEIYRLLASATVVYSTPNRVSLEQTFSLADRFLAEKSGGDRAEAVCAALFRAVAAQFGIFDEVRRLKVNVADAASGMGADIECRFKGRIALLVEVKDRSLTLTQMDAKLDVARSRKVSEILFLAEAGLEPEQKPDAGARIASEFSSGQNVYVSNFRDFSTGILMLLGERGRVLFLGFVGEELDKANSAILHRRAWAQLLKSL